MTAAVTPPVWEVRDLESEGRFGIFKDGVCQGVVHSQEEVKRWFWERSGEEEVAQSLHRAIEQCRG